MIRLHAMLLLLAIVGPAAAAEQVAEADEPPEAPSPLHRWELDLFGGYGQLAWPSLSSQTTRWSNGGAAFAITAAHRSPHVTHPFLDIAYVPFVSTGQDVLLADGTSSIYTTASTHAWAFTLGPGFDVEWFRLRAGVGLSFVTTSTTAQGVTSSSTSTRLGYLVSAAALAWQRDPFAVGAEARLFALNSPGQGIFQTAWSLGLTGRWDFARY